MEAMSIYILSWVSRGLKRSTQKMTDTSTAPPYVSDWLIFLRDSGFLLIKLKVYDGTRWQMAIWQKYYLFYFIANSSFATDKCDGGKVPLVPPSVSWCLFQLLTVRGVDPARHCSQELAWLDADVASPHCSHKSLKNPLLWVLWLRGNCEDSLSLEYKLFKTDGSILQNRLHVNRECQ